MVRSWKVLWLSRTVISKWSKLCLRRQYVWKKDVSIMFSCWQSNERRNRSQLRSESPRTASENEFTVSAGSRNGRHIIECLSCHVLCSLNTTDLATHIVLPQLQPRHLRTTWLKRDGVLWVPSRNVSHRFCFTQPRKEPRLSCLSFCFLLDNYARVVYSTNSNSRTRASQQ